MADKSTIIEALRKWINQRPGLEFGNYGDVSSYRAEMRSITKDLHHARAMLDYVAWHDSITADAILHTDARRLTITINGDKMSIDYTVGQYWPTEYRRAVCALLSSIIWTWLRENNPGLDGHGLRAAASRELGRTIGRRWFK